MYVLDQHPKVYVKLPEKPKIATSVALWKDFLKPLSMVTLLGGLGLSFLYYITKGPKLPKFDEGGEQP